MRILVACDSFKDALSAVQACRAIAKGLEAGDPELVVEEMPLSDGGEGALDVLKRHLSLAPISLEVADPLFRPVEASYGISPGGDLALVEMAQASGLERVALSERNPCLTTSFGTGELLADARRRGAVHALLAIGGSATNDAGIGAAAALGWQFLDAGGERVKPVGGALQAIVRIVPPSAPLFERLEILCDVTNPLFGPKGAAFTYGRQKGGDDQSLKRLDRGLRHIAHLVEQELGLKGLADVPGAGAAGGMGFGAVAFLKGTLKRGIDMVLDSLDFADAARRADLVITGEGRLDRQSAQGKLIQGVCSRAGATPVIALCGELAISPEEVRAMGLKAAYSINPLPLPKPDMLAATAGNLEKTARDLVALKRI